MSLFKTFVGELILITLRNLTVTETSVNTANEIITISIPLTKQGYLLEEDKFNYFFGITPDFVSFSIKKRDVSMFELYDALEPLPDKNTTLLNNMAVPTNKKDIN